MDASLVSKSWAARRRPLSGLVLLILGASLLQAQVSLTEFAADNETLVADEDGTYEDWIEIANLGLAPTNLAGWFLTDELLVPRKWPFPATNLAGGTYLLVFASGKDRRQPGAPLHTSFKLSSDGEYLALVAPDGLTVVTAFSPAYPRQFPNVSFGFGSDRRSVRLLETNAPARWTVPSAVAPAGDWTAPGFADSSWAAGTNGFGYDTGELDPLENSYAGQVIASGPVLYWRIQETTGPTAINAGTLADTAQGVYQGDPALGDPGPVPPGFANFEPDNRAVTLDGMDDYMAGPTNLLGDRNAFTLAGWIRPAGAQANRTGLWGQNDAVEFGFSSSGNLQLWTWQGAAQAAYPFAAQEWHHVAAVGTGQALQIYLDGVLVASAAAAGPYPSSPYAFNVGGGGVFDATGNHFVGQMDEVAVWTRALSSSELQQLLQGSSAVDYRPLIRTEVGAALRNVNPSLYLRFPFSVSDPSVFQKLWLHLRYDDGFVAYLNGVEIARQNAPATLAWDSSATDRRADLAAIQAQAFDLTPALGLLTPGNNLLAIHALNIGATNTDLLFEAVVEGVDFGGLGTDGRYLMQPTPGAPNGSGVADVGPILQGAQHTPAEPRDSDNLLVTAPIRPAFHDVASATLHYRVMFGSETTLPMNDSGTAGDATAGDGTWSAVIPDTVAGPGQLVRYYVTATDTAGNPARWPLFPDPTDSEAYQGTVVQDPALETALPLIHVFVENIAAGDTRAGTLCALYYLGELYDTVTISLHGQSTSGFAKKSYNLDFPADHRFRWRPGSARAKDIRLMSNWADKARIRNALAYDLIEAAGGHGHFAFQVRLQRNGQFFSIADLMEDADDRWLERLGRDPNGALYKMYNNLSAASGNEKKTRRWADFTDLQGLVTNLDETLPAAQRVVYACDRLELPQTISYFVGLALASSQDHGHKNYYLYCDNDGSGEWAILPWDVDLTWGRNWLGSGGYLVDTLFQDNDLDFYNLAQQNKPANRLYNLILGQPEFRQMYLRRLRTVMDSILQAPGTPSEALQIEARIRTMLDLMDPPAVGTSDADLDYQRWGSWGNTNAMRPEAARVFSQHLPGRRQFLFHQNPLVYGDPIPPSQPATVQLQFGQVEFNPASGNQREEFIELTNANALAVDLSGWRIDGAVRHVFRPGTVLPAGRRLFVSPDVRAFRARQAGPRGGQGLYVQGNYSGQLSAWGETLSLMDAAGRLVATNTYPGNPSPAQRFLRITEIMYNPAPLAGSTNEAQAFEYLELRNTGPDPLSLSGARLTNGIYFDFSTGAVTQLAAGERVVVVRDPGAFAQRYGVSTRIAGQFAGSLDSRGETIRLEDALGEKVLEFSYNNAWYPVTDGLGFSLVIVDDQAPWDTWGERASWRPSGQLQGNPGSIDPGLPPIPPILVNEVLAHTDPPQWDSVELHNPAPQEVDLGGWFLSDDLFAPRKYRFPAGTKIAGGGYLLLTEAHFNPPPGTPPGFSFSSVGDEVYLFSADATTNLTGYLHGFRFGATANGVSLGRYVNSLGEEDFVPQRATSLAATNAGPLVGPLVISEIMFRPPDLGREDNDLDEFIELRNIAATPTSLFDPAARTNTWRLRNGVDFDFPTNTTVPTGGQLLVVGFDPADTARLAAFRATYQLGTTVPVFGPWVGKLDNSGETLELKKPDPPNTNEVPYVLVEKIAYRDGLPWPAGADGTGASLQRRGLSAYGNEPTNWFAAAATPGATNTVNLLPSVQWLQPVDGSTHQRPVDLTLEAAAVDPDGRVARVEFLANGHPIGQVTQAPYRWTWTNVPAGLHTLAARATDDRAGAATTPAASITVRAQPPTIQWLSPGPQTLVGLNLATPLHAGASSPDGTIAQVDFYADGNRVGTDFTSPFEVAWTPVATGAVALAAVALDTLGAAATSAVTLVHAVPVLQLTHTNVPAGDVWRYLDNGSDQGTNWTTLSFDDTGWPTNRAKFGYGGDGETTRVSYGPSATDKHITTYFRTRFVLATTEGVTAARLRLVRDDGAAVYLNGTGVVLANLPSTGHTYRTLATATVSGTNETNFFLHDIPVAWLRIGTNVLAAEVHQVTTNSSDLGFDAQLEITGTVFGPALLALPQSVAVAAGATARFQAQAAGTPPLSYQWLLNSNPVSGATNSTLELPDVSTSDLGHYVVRVTNAAGSVTSPPAQLTFLDADQDGDGLPDDWESLHGLDPRNPRGADGASGDPDGDGMTNRQEYQAGTRPDDATSVLRIDRVEWQTGGRLWLGFNTVSNRTYTLEWRPDVGSAWFRLADIPSAPTNRWLSVLDSSASNQSRLYRLATPALP